ncbi:MAG: hypothetical protein UX38_C0012G0008 [Microgenomates group bacterium GW2011_GWC1_46_16]|uniref:Uncharacterized protein n=2 Tax=Bacteria candidate phyla TaxID=1783234 RepID=A0A1F5FZB7_9BACT|nr:MAG: hypothetical protein UV00_C0023G0011 [candidate division WWE3 bacterium GW2011_GWF1_42_14]KKU25922.1 MAG: hypothetical protein UX38_C0012G0008 [Microgenomates group bacterium GW2011_GWC1_46_16]KKU27688.1 MAG: hypothetical protein UX40_C0008G0009 [Microgenomates group bacterium GW2011_GWF2_46_18]KKU43357.1 MAG: hypothetical protein UX59_C0021G0015 [Microgenomates group bacterium GW2011_GWA1_46_7]KKU60613.1 MAG: hypothetical protein UX82_C0009G0016 [Microgenomates group bacterium GW2011_G
MNNLSQQAVDYALSNNWELAVETNLEILDLEPNNIAALNRLARAYTELGQKDSAESVYQKVLSLDKYNSVALKNLRVLPHQKVSCVANPLSREDFIEESGLTKTVFLIKVASRELLLSLCCKEIFYLTPKSRLISVTSADGTYIGSFPDDLSLRLKWLLTHGYSYTVCLKNASDNSVCVFLRELKRPTRKTALPSFSKALKIPVKSSK